MKDIAEERAKKPDQQEILASFDSYVKTCEEETRSKLTHEVNVREVGSYLMFRDLTIALLYLIGIIGLMVFLAVVFFRLTIGTS